MDRPLLRPLRPAELPAVAAIHAAAFPESWLTALGPATIERYYDWQLRGPHEAYPFSASLDGRLAGFCFGGIFPTAISGFLRRNRAHLAWRVVARPRLVANPRLYE
ncbi:MAG: hypothetical protein WA814_09590, partial [Candidatus Baltobacteraceae bacterium]